MADAIKVLVDAFELVSFILLLRTAYRRPDGTFELRPSRIWRHRISRRTFLFEVMIAVPAYTLAVHCTPTKGSPVRLLLPPARLLLP